MASEEQIREVQDAWGDHCSREDAVWLVRRADEILAALERVLAQNETTMAAVR